MWWMAIYQCKWNMNECEFEGCTSIIGRWLWVQWTAFSRSHRRSMERHNILRIRNQYYQIQFSLKWIEKEIAWSTYFATIVLTLKWNQCLLVDTYLLATGQSQREFPPILVNIHKRLFCDYSRVYPVDTRLQWLLEPVIGGQRIQG